MTAASADLRRHALGGSSARSLLFTVLGEYVLRHGGAVWSSALLDALRALGVEEKAARQAMARAAIDGWLAREREGRRVRWTLTARAESLLREGAGRIYSFGGPVDDWDGRWVIVLANVPESQRDVRHRLRTRLGWAGFGPLTAGVWLSPHVAREDEAADVVRELGVGATSFVARAGVVGDERDLVEQAWDLHALEARYRDFIDAFHAPSRTAFVSHTRLVHEWRKFPFIDPGLPSRLLPAGWVGNAAHELFLVRRAAGLEAATAWFESHEDAG